MSLTPSKKPLTFIERHGIRNVLVIKLTSLGDVVHALPAAAALKKTFPFLRLHWVVEDRCAPILEHHPLLESIVVYPRREIQSLLSRRKWGPALQKLLALRASLVRLQADLSLDLQGLAKSGLMAWLANAPHRIGCSGLKEFSFLISRCLPGGEDLHAVDRNLQVAAYLGAKTVNPEFVLGLQDKEKRWAEDFLTLSGMTRGSRLAAIHLGASLPQKKWPLYKFIDLLERIGGTPGFTFLLMGETRDESGIESFGGRLPGALINTTGRLSLRQLMALTARCRVFIGADTGPLHLAAALGVPVIALCGPDDPKWTGPYGKGHRVHYKKLACSPCNKNPVCQGRYDCLEAIEVEEVFESFQSLMNGP